MAHSISAKEAAFWADIRKQFYLRDGVTFLNGGSIGPSARPVIEKTVDLMRIMESDPLQYQRQIVAKAMNEAREKLGAFVGASPDRIAFVQNTTMGINIPAQGLPFKRGSEIVMSDQEYPAVQHLWRYIAKRNRMKLREFPLPTPPSNPQDIVDAYAEQMTDRAAVMVFSHVYYTTGLATDVKALSALAHRHGALAIIDGAHAVGMVPMVIEDIGCDFYASSCHKWLLAPKGVGMLYIAKKHQNKVLPLIKGYNTHDTDSASRYDMTGTRDMTHHAGLGYAIDFQHEIGWDTRIRPYCNGLARYLKERVKEMPNGRLMVPESPEESGFLTSFTIDGVRMGELARILLEKYQIETALPHPNGIPSFRISTHFYNNHHDVDRLIDAIREVIASRDEVTAQSEAVA